MCCYVTETEADKPRAFICCCVKETDDQGTSDQEEGTPIPEVKKPNTKKELTKDQWTQRELTHDQGTQKYLTQDQGSQTSNLNLGSRNGPLKVVTDTIVRTYRKQMRFV